jgi:hypothetical protein
VLAALLVVLFLASVAAPLVVERSLHRWGSDRIGRLAFVNVGTRPLARVRERIETGTATYRGGAVRRHVRVPAGTWALVGPNGGTIHLTVEPGHRYAVARVVALSRRGREQRTYVNTVLRITPARDAEGHVLQARALPEGLIFALGLPIGVIWLAALDEFPLLLVGSFVLALVATALFQLQWWLFHGALVREAAAIALVAVAGEVENDGQPPVRDRAMEPLSARRR